MWLLCIYDLCIRNPLIPAMCGFASGLIGIEEADMGAQIQK